MTIGRLNQKIVALAAVTAGLAMTGAAQAQERGFYASVEWGRGPGQAFDHVQGDLDRAAGSYISPDAHRRIDHARKEVWDFQRKLAAGKYDKHNLDGAISAVNHVVENPSLNYRDRQNLQQDLYVMRGFRANGGAAGGGFSAGYR